MVLALALCPLLATLRPSPSSAADPILTRRATVALVSHDPKPAPPVVPPGPAAPAGTTFVLNEVRFSAAPGAAAFVELRNTGPATVSPSGLVLASGGASYVLPPGIPGAAPGGLVVVLFDGGGPTSGATFHAPLTSLPGAGSLALLAGGARLDAVDWGDGSLAPGGAIQEPAAGSVAARVPAGGASGTPWALLGPAQATPGAPNPVPAVSAFASPDGAVFSSSTPKLSWYSVPGATRYRVELSASRTFAALLADRTVSATRPGALTPENLAVGPLSPGLYYWRVTALYPSGASAVSASQRVGVRGGVTAAAVTAEKRLPVPRLNQRKDTAMLQLENPAEDGPLAWDKPDADMPTRPYCVYAGVAMLNRYYGGDWSVDYAHYVTLKDQAPGPELDLQERGATIYEERAAIREALGVDPGPPTVIETTADLQAFHAKIRAEIDAGRPLAARWPAHAVLIIGYADQDEFGNFSIVVQDGNGPAWARSEFPEASLSWLAYLTIPAGGQGADQGKVTADSDGDGVVDFDESDRFHTNVAAKDSDHDKLNDKQDIRASIWDERHGSARGGPGRDFDGDGLPMERDPDADGGGCFDGMEDVNKDGKFDDGSEGDNFQRADDPCLGGTSLLVRDDTVHYDDGGTHHSLQNVRATLSLQEDGDGGWTGVASITYFIEAKTLNPGDFCPVIEIPRVTVTGESKLTGVILAGKLQISAEPDTGPPITYNVIGCGPSTSHDVASVPWFGGWGQITFTDGRYDFRQDYPLGEDSTGENYVEVHLHQPRR